MYFQISNLLNLLLFLYIQNKRLYKRLNLMFYQWKNFIHTTTNYFVKTTIECGAACNSHWDQCDLFVFQENKKRCHIGVSEQNNNYLNGIGGEWPVHLRIGNITKKFTQPDL